MSKQWVTCPECEHEFPEEFDASLLEDADLYEVFRERDLCDLDTVVEWLEGCRLLPHELDTLADAFGLAVKRARRKGA